MIGDSSIQPTPGFPDPGTWRPTRQTKTPTTSDAAASTSADTADSVEISKSGSLLEVLNEGLFWGVKPRADGAIHLEDVKEAYDKHLSQFKTKLAQLLQESGIDRSREAVLQVDTTGRVRVAGDHPDKAAIEALFEERPEMANEFRLFSATASLLHAAEQAKPFWEAYAKNPQAAVQRWSHLFSDDRQVDFNLRITVDDMMEFITAG